MELATLVALVQQWQDAANCRDTSLLQSLSAPEIEMVGPRGTACGHRSLSDWVQRAGVHFTTLRTFARANHVVLTQRGVWEPRALGETPGEALVASSFRVENAQITRVARFDVLEQALLDAQLTLGDELSTYEG